MIQTVLGPVDELPPGYIDAHGHVWIDGIEGTDPDVTFVLSDEAAIIDELKAYRSAGGGAVIDCMPQQAGRNVGRLARISSDSGVAIIAATGFHLPQYYPPAPNHGPWALSASEAQALFENELANGIPVDQSHPNVQPGVIKTAHPGRLDPRFCELFQAALAASATTGVAVMVHTERGEAVEEIVPLVENSPVPPGKVILCHVDKRPDAHLHAELAKAGFLLEYDTFLRPKYDPDTHVWPLIETLLANNYEDSIACGLDLADSQMWAFGGDANGMVGLTTVVAARLRTLGANQAVTDKLLRANIASRISSEANCVP